MERYPRKEKSISTVDILETLDRFGARSKTPSPVHEEDCQSKGDSVTPELSPLADDPLGSQRLSIISADGSEIDSDYSSASSVIHVSDEQRNLEREWQFLFGSTAYYAKIRQHALEGNLRSSHFRSVCWKIFLECLPEHKDDWITKATQLRNEYQEFKTKCMLDPNKAKNRAMDLSVFNPLSQDDNSPWKQYFEDNDLKSTIKQDLDRLFPEIEFFQQSKVKEMMLSILFCHAKKNEALSYKQGMHELLAPIIYVLNEDLKIFEHLDGFSLKIARFLMDPKYLEHDAFALFVQLMDQTETWYLQLPTVGISERNKVKLIYGDLQFLDPHAEPFTEQDTLPCTAVVKKLSRIHEHMLRKYDPELWVRLKNMDIAPQVYGLRWIRLLFGREFPMDDVLVLWDALFADGPLLDLVDYIYICMLEAIRDKLLVGSYSACMGFLMKFPRTYNDVHRFVKNALTMRQKKLSSATRSSPRPSRPSAPRHLDSASVHAHKKKQGVKRPQSAFTSFTKRYQQLVEPTKQTASRPTAKLPGPEAPSVNSFLEEELVPKGSRPGRPVSVPPPEMRDRSDSGSQSSSPVKTMKSLTNPLKGKLMTRPRTRSKVEYDELAQDHERLQIQVSSLKSELDKIQGLYLYCGRKMDSYIDLLQDELANDDDSGNDVVYLCLAGLKQVRDLLKGTLAFRGSTLEHECDFMEIDNNIASRLQVPSLHQMQSDNLPDSIPVPMLGNFGHFENDALETESSFMTGKVDDQKTGGDQSTGLTDDHTCANNENMDKKRDENKTQSALDSKSVVAKSGSFEKRGGDEPKTSVPGLVEEEGAQECRNLEYEQPARGGSAQSNPSRVEIFDAVQGSADNLSGSAVFSNDIQQRTESNPIVDSNQGHTGEHKGLGIAVTERNFHLDPDYVPLSKFTKDFDSKVQLHSPHPLSDTEDLRSIRRSCIPEVRSPEHDFVFVNHDGTAMNSPRLPRHPLENDNNDDDENNIW